MKTIVSYSYSLAERLRARIRREGPIAFRDWMDAALYDETEGYYCRPDRVRWGRAGDYRTSPERSQLFAATFARYFARLYQELDSPPKWTILEAGAGAGHFARGVLESLARWHQKVFEATRYVIDEASADARLQLQDNLRAFEDRVAFLRLHEIEAPIGVGIVFSKELLDAMPVHRVVKRGGKLLELCVGLNHASEFVWVELEPSTLRLAAYFQSIDVILADGQFAEVNLDAGDWLCHAGSRLNRGFTITVDYGEESKQLYDAEHRREGTLRAFQKHHVAENVLAEPGTKDITTTVDWAYLRSAGEHGGLETVRLERQDQFLMKEGLLDVLKVMNASEQSSAEKLVLSTGAREMILPDGMSSRFQVLVQRRRAAIA